ncbi:MAG: hypothetical protein AB8B91_14345 [Rubripirellula sp.]
MSQTLPDAQASTPLSVPSRETDSSSWLETFVHSFFQEKNIKWMLVVGAAIVFGSSLMLVTKAWPDWPVSLKYLTILGYTTVIFLAGEVSRRRLKLNATPHVLGALTLLLLPICFLSLTWLSSGTAVQSSLLLVPYLGLLFPAVALLWFASTTILDHWLRGRQTTFLLSFNLLCVAGALPAITSPLLAFGFLAVCWLVFTAGVMKVNRHTFWLAEEKRLPRVFGFLPIAMLGLQFVTLVSIKAIAALPSQWIGFSIVLVSATVLMTARTVADVYRRRSGDLVRPLPWTIVIPLFSGLVLAAVGLGLSMVGFSYVGATTYAVLPAAVVVAVLLSLVARDTRHPGFVWAALGVVGVAYQCSPTLFADFVQAARAVTADAITQERVPISMYGLTYLPLLGTLTLVSRRFAKQSLTHFSKPIKQFVTALSLILFAVALADVLLLRFVSPFLVSTINVLSFGMFAIAFRDRRYMIAASVAFIVASATAIPALNAMGYLNVAEIWIPTLLACLAMLLTVSRIPDRLINRISVPESDVWMTDGNGQSRNLLQLIGCVLAVPLAIHWIISTAVAFDQPLTQTAILQFVFLLAAFVRYTLRSAHYLPAASVWALVGYAVLRWGVGGNHGFVSIVSVGTYGLVAVSVVGLICLRWLKAKTGKDSMSALRCSVGFDLASCRSVARIPKQAGGAYQIAAFTLPLVDLCTLVLSTLGMIFHLAAVAYQHASLFGVPAVGFVGFGLSTQLLLIWMFVMAWMKRDRAFGLIAGMLLPVFVTSVLISFGWIHSLIGILLVWAVVQATLTLVSHLVVIRNDLTSEAVLACRSIRGVGQAWTFGLLAISCLSFDLPMRLVAAICAFSLGITLVRTWDRDKLCGLAILTNVNVLLLAAAVGGCSGWLLPGLIGSASVFSVPLVFLTGTLSVLLFERAGSRIDGYIARQWALLLRMGLVSLGLISIVAPRMDLASIAAMTAGFGVLVVVEVMQAIKRNREVHVWIGCVLVAFAACFLFSQNVISFGVGISQVVLLALSVIGLTVAHLADRHQRLAVFRRPMLMVGQSLPALVAVLAVVREFSGYYSSLTALNSLSLMVAAGIYFHQAAAHGRRIYCLPGIAIANVGLLLLWKTLSWSSPELYMVPIGLSVLGFAEIMKRELPAAAQRPLQYIGLLTILCSPLPEVLGGSWIHILSLMVLSVIVILSAIGLRVRSLVYAGSAFLLVDLVAMVIRSTMHNVNLLWACGIALGIAVIALAAFCESHRDKLLLRIRMVSAELATWN